MLVMSGYDFWLNGNILERLIAVISMELILPNYYHLLKTRNSYAILPISVSVIAYEQLKFIGLHSV